MTLYDLHDVFGAKRSHISDQLDWLGAMNGTQQPLARLQQQQLRLDRMLLPSLHVLTVLASVAGHGTAVQHTGNGIMSSLALGVCTGVAALPWLMSPASYASWQSVFATVYKLAALIPWTLPLLTNPHVSAVL